MIKLQDFAKKQGVTDRAIQKHLKTYADELDGLYERKGPNGTWLTDEACEILKSKMKQHPVDFFKEDPRVEVLEAENERLQRELNEANANFRKYATETAAALAEANHNLQLAERAGSIEAENKELKDKIAAVEKKASEDVQKAQRELKSSEDENHLLKQQIASMKKASLWQRIRGWKE